MTNWEKTFTTCISDKGQWSVSKEFLKSRKYQQPDRESK